MKFLLVVTVLLCYLTLQSLADTVVSHEHHLARRFLWPPTTEEDGTFVNLYTQRFDSLGDFNGDGIKDIVFGFSGPLLIQWSYSNAQVNISYNSLDLVDLGVGSIFSTCGLSAVVNLLDINKDNLADVGIGCWDGAYLVLGSANFQDLSSSVAISNVNQPSVDGLGDVNGDGFNDAIVSDNLSGVAFLIYGGSALSSLDAISLAQGEGVIFNSTNPAIPLVGTRAGDVSRDWSSRIRKTYLLIFVR